MPCLGDLSAGGKTINYPKDEKKAASVKYSVPTELIESLTADYGSKLAMSHLEYSLKTPETYLRMNQLRCSEAELSAALGDVSLVKTALAGCYTADGAVTGTEAFRKGFFHVQDMSSQLCCHALAPTENDTVLDICAAPGGKTFTMAELMGGKGRICAFDPARKARETHSQRCAETRSGKHYCGSRRCDQTRSEASAVYKDTL